MSDIDKDSGLQKSQLNFFYSLNLVAQIILLLQRNPVCVISHVLLEFFWTMQFNLIENHGTRVIIYNLWEDDQGQLELDFGSDQHVCDYVSSSTNVFFHFLALPFLLNLDFRFLFPTLDNID